MRLVGETVKIITETGPTYDADGYLIDWGGRREQDVPGCVIVPKGADVAPGADYTLASKEVSVLAPVFLDELEEGAELEIRGESYTVSAPVFHHRSPFGTSRGGTEIPAERRTVT